MLKRSLSQAIQHNARAFVCREPTFNTPVTMFRIPHAVASNILEADFLLTLSTARPGAQSSGLQPARSQTPMHFAAINATAAS